MEIGKVVTYHEEPLILQLCAFVRSCDMLNTFYLHLHCTNGHKHGKVVSYLSLSL